MTPRGMLQVIHLAPHGESLTLCGVRPIATVTVIAPHVETCRERVHQLAERRRQVARGESDWRPLVGLMERAS